MKNAVGGKHQLTQNISALPLVCRTDGADHAFLVYESLASNGAYGVKIAELGHKNLSDDPENPKFDVTKAQIYYEQSTEEWVKKKGEGWLAVTNNIDGDQVALLETRIKTYQEMDLNYIKLGKTRLNNILGASSAYSSGTKKGLLGILEASNEKSHSKASHYSFHSLDASLRDGHNCISWVIEMWKALGLDYRDSFLGKFVVVHPTVELKQQIKASESSDKSQCCVM